MKKLLAFTLAEVLLTMSIVGTVAAMTIPTLYYNRVRKEYTTKLKNFYSHMENAVMDMQMDKGSFQNFVHDHNNGTINGLQPFDWYMEYIDPYMGHQYVDTKNKKIYFKDGSAIVKITEAGCVDLRYDLNGGKGPNRLGYDIFQYLYCFTDDKRVTYWGNKDIFFGVYGKHLQDSGTTREQMIEKCIEKPYWCTKLLQNDQWEFKNDYPYRF